MKTIPERTQASKSGLISMCDYLNSQFPLAVSNMLEIGAYTGVSAEIFCQRFKRVISVDPWQNNTSDITHTVNMAEVYKIFVSRLSKYSNITVLKHFAADVVANFRDETFEFVYIDGAHDYKNVLNDIMQWLPKVKKGFYIGGHDYHNTKFPGVVQAVNEAIGKPDKTFPDTSWIRKV